MVYKKRKYGPGENPNSILALKESKSHYPKGHTPWNRGLTKETNELVKKNSLAKIKYNFDDGVIKKMVNDKRTLVEISEYFGCSISGLYEYMKKRGIKAMGHLESHYREECRCKCREHRMLQRFDKKETSIELIMRELLETHKINFEPQKRVLSTFPDFYVETNGHKYCIYCDGDYWHNLEKVRLRDRRINKELIQSGYLPIRFTETELNKNIQSVEKRLEFVGVL